MESVKKPQILIVEDEKVIRTSLRKLLERHNYCISDAVSVKAARKNFNLNHFDLIISDLRLPGAFGTELINMAPDVPVVIMTSYASLRSAVDTMRQGAADYISKPFDHEEILSTVKRVTSELDQGKRRRTARNNLLMGKSPQILKIINRVQKVAPTLAPVLIHGEIGSGRRTIAETAHSISAFSKQPFVTINCASISADQLLDELKDQTQKTLFFNNICELPKTQQAIASTATNLENIRVIASTEQDLEALSNLGQFRKDLLYNLAVIKIEVPSLREHANDIPLLIEYFIYKYSAELGYSVNLTPEALQALSEHSWPGNVKELQDTIYQAMLLCDPGEAITAETVCLSNKHDHQLADQSEEHWADVSLEEYFSNFVLQNQQQMTETELASKLGISRKSLWERRIRLEIPRKKN